MYQLLHVHTCWNYRYFSLYNTPAWILLLGVWVVKTILQDQYLCSSFSILLWYRYTSQTGRQGYTSKSYNYCTYIVYTYVQNTTLYIKNIREIEICYCWYMHVSYRYTCSIPKSLVLIFINLFVINLEILCFLSWFVWHFYRKSLVLCVFNLILIE